jgi:hypothetical protein
MSTMHVETGTPKEFLDFIGGVGVGCVDLGRKLAEKLEVPFHEDRLERPLGYRYAGWAETYITVTDAMKEEILPKMRWLIDGEVIECDSRPAQRDCVPLTERAWTREHDPDSCNGIAAAIGKVRGAVIGIYYCYKKMNLVLIDEAGQKIGIRSVDIMQFETELIPELFKLKSSAGDGHDA